MAFRCEKSMYASSSSSVVSSGSAWRIRSISPGLVVVVCVCVCVFVCVCMHVHACLRELL